MTNTLQQIRDEYAYEHKFEGWADLQDYYIYWDNEKLENAIDQIAIRYAQEQKRDLVEMLEIINEGINTMDFTQLEVLHNKIESLITKHKQS